MKRILLASAAALALTGGAGADHWKNDWKDCKRCLTYCVPKGEKQAFKDDVDKAAKKWNDAKTGWTFKKSTDPKKCDIVIKTGFTGTSNGNITAPFPSCKPKVCKATIKINRKGTKGPRQRTIAHELGHAMRLKHVKDDGMPGGDLMEVSQGVNDTNLCPTKNDIKEAKDAAKTKKTNCVSLPASTTTATTVVVDITADSDTNFDLAHATSVSVTAIDPETLHVLAGQVVVDPDQQSIKVAMTPLDGALHHEFYEVAVSYQDKPQAVFHGLLLVTEEPPPAGLPQAAVPSQIVALAGQLTEIDGTGSSHGAGSPMTSHWIVDPEDEDSAIVHQFDQPEGIRGFFSFDSGVHTVRLVVEDEWGRTSEADTTVTVLGDIFGEPCQGESEFVPDIMLGGEPKAGTPFSLALQGLPDSSGFLFLGVSTTSWQGIPLPLSLDAFGFPECTLYVAPTVMLPFVTDADGEAEFPLPGLGNGLKFYAQGFFQDAGASTNGSLTKALEVNVKPSLPPQRQR